MRRMNLDTYLRKPGSKRLTDLAMEAGVTPGRLSQLRESLDWPPQLAMAVEAATDRVLDAAILSPVVAQARGKS